MANALCLILTNAAADKLLKLYNTSNQTHNLDKDEIRAKAVDVLRKMLQIGIEQQCIVSKAPNGKYLIYIPAVRIKLVGVIGENPQKFKVIDIGTWNVETPWGKSVELQFYDEGTIPSFVQTVDAIFWDEIESLKTDPENFDVANQKVKEWEAYLWVQERLAEDRLYRVSYEYFHASLDWTRIEFLLANREELDWEAINHVVGKKMYLEMDHTTHLGLGILIDYSKSDGILVVELEDSVHKQIIDGELQIPNTATLVYKNYGALADIKRQRNALKCLVSGQAVNKNLPNLLFDLETYIENYTPVQVDVSSYTFVNPKLDEYQKQAVAGALSAQDLYLVKGPPGTGKTSVIAEICVQAARQGKKVLVASQTNVAVDNVLEKFVNTPNIRPIRFKNEAKYDDATDVFSPTNAVTNWLERINRHAQMHWEEYNNIDSLLTELMQFRDFVQKYVNALKEKSVLQKELADVQETIIQHNTVHEELIGKIKALDDKIKNIELLNVILARQDLKHFSMEFDALNARELCNTNSTCQAVAQEIKALTKSLQEFIAGGTGVDVDEPFAVIQNGLTDFLWFKEHRQEIDRVIATLNNTIDKLVILIKHNKAYQDNHKKWSELRQRHDIELGVYQEQTAQIDRFHHFLTQLNAVQKMDYNSIWQWAYQGINDRVLIINNLFKFVTLDTELKTKLGELIGQKTDRIISQCLETQMFIDNLSNSITIARKIMGHFDEAAKVLQEKLNGTHGAIATSNFDGLSKLKKDFAISVIDIKRSDPKTMNSLLQDVENLVDLYLNRGVIGVVGNAFRTLKDGVGQLFGGASVSEKREQRQKENLMVSLAGKKYFADLIAEWTILEEKMRSELTTLTKMLVEQTQSAVAETVLELKNQYDRELRVIKAKRQNQTDLINSLEREVNTFPDIP